PCPRDAPLASLRSSKDAFAIALSLGWCPATVARPKHAGKNRWVRLFRCLDSPVNYSGAQRERGSTAFLEVGRSRVARRGAACLGWCPAPVARPLVFPGKSRYVYKRTHRFSRGGSGAQR